MTSSAAPVAVVVPCYRCSPTIERLVESVRDQTAVPAELVLVDDGSGDETPERLKELQGRYGSAWLKIISIPSNSGPAQARNAGWEASGQPFVAFADSDNAWHPRKIELQYGWMKEHPDAQFSGHRMLRIGEAGPPPELPAAWKARRVLLWRQYLSNRFPTSSIMIRSDCPIRYDPDRRYSEDYLLWTRIMGSGMAGFTLEIPLGYYFKPLFGHSGLSGDLWAMEKKELQSYRFLEQAGHLPWPAYRLLTIYSLAKYARRELLTRARGAITKPGTGVRPGRRSPSSLP